MWGHATVSDESPENTIEMSTKGLDQLLKALKRNLPTARVGILGDKNARSSGTATSNATVGAAHEFGTEKLPVRSFLRVPIAENLDKYLEKSGAFDPNVLKQVLRDGSILEWMRKVAITAEAVVADAFNSGGFGKWPISDMTHKKNHQTLVETQQLRNSITSEVRE